MERPRSYWDFSETKGYREINNYRVLSLNPKQDEQVAIMLHKIRQNIKYLVNAVKSMDINDKGVHLLIHHHDKYFVLQEINHPLFIGMNKPKGVKNGHASRRSIFLTLRNGNTLHSEKRIMKLCIHELAHTMANHVIFIDDNHGPDFQKYENFLLRVARRIKKFPI